MAIFSNGETELYYEVRGEGFPVLLIAPGGMQSAVTYWENAPWNPLDVLATRYQVIAMDQRNAGQSRGPISADDGWSIYTGDQLALLDHLGVSRFHVAGMCIGGPYAMGLIEAAPARVASAVMFQPIGAADNQQAFFEMFDAWAAGLKATHPALVEADWQRFRQAMFGGDFLFNVDRDFVAACQTPLLVLCGRDLYHPEATSREVAALAPRAEFVEHWKEPEHIASGQKRVEDFLAANTPG